MKTEHTPTPWIESKAINGENDICADNGHGGYSGTFIGTVKNKADRQFIVKACNNHQQLIEQLKIAYDELTNSGYDQDGIIMSKIYEALKASE